MIRFSLDCFQRFEELTGGHSCGFRRTGYLLGVDDKMRKPMEASVTLQRSVGIETRLVSPTEMRDIEPRLQIEDLVAGCYEPDSGYCNPAETARRFARARASAAARPRGDRGAQRPDRRGDRVTGVNTTRGEIRAPRVINAAGLWGSRIGAMMGLDIPISVCRHKISIVSWPEAIRRPHPMVYDFVNNIYTRPELGEHILVGGLDAEESHDLADPDHYKEGVSLDESTDALARVSHRFPVLAEGRIARGYAGCFDVTPDWRDPDQVGPGQLRRGRVLRPRHSSRRPWPHDGALVTRAGRPSDLPFRLSRFAEGEPIRGTYGDWLMC
jgi:glycine/D-amino acid oxidase-like deaminating enzyme